MSDSPIEFLDGRVILRPGDCLEVIRLIPDGSIDAIVTDPPYALVSIAKRFGSETAAPAQHGTDGAFARASRGFMGKEWDTGDVAFAVEFWRECMRVLKPGGYVVAFSGTRTYHRLACAIEDAGFEIRDQVAYALASDEYASAFMDSLNDEQRAAFVRLLDETAPTGQLAWAYGTGFPKAHDVSKAIDKHLGVDRKVVGKETLPNDMRNSGLLNAGKGGERPAYERDVTEAGSAEAAEWEGWKSALKPAWEPIVMARKPLDGTIAENILKHGTGALNIGATRIDAEKVTGWGGAAGGSRERVCTPGNKEGDARPVQGRFPANIVHDGSEEVLAAFPAAAGQQGTVTGLEPSPASGGAVTGKRERVASLPPIGDGGSAARFFYSAKADKDDRLRSDHPTVKPVDLMQWLVRMVCRKGGVVLDPFAGTGTTGQAAFYEGCDAVLIEREPEYQADIAFRMKLALAGPDERKRARTKIDPPEGLPLFAPEAPISHAGSVDETQTLDAAE